MDKKFDIAIDKGTYDAIALCPIDPKAKRYLYKEFLFKIMKNQAIYVITSCNWTSKELNDFFTEDKGKWILNQDFQKILKIKIFLIEFELVDEIKAPSNFMFGGSSGSTTSTLIFKFIK